MGAPIYKATCPDGWTVDIGNGPDGYSCSGGTIKPGSELARPDDADIQEPLEIGIGEGKEGGPLGEGGPLLGGFASSP